MTTPARDAGIGISPCYRYLHEAIEVLAAEAPELFEVRKQRLGRGDTHIVVDSALIPTDRATETTPGTVIRGGPILRVGGWALRACVGGSTNGGYCCVVDFVTTKSSRSGSFVIDQKSTPRNGMVVTMRPARFRYQLFIPGWVQIRAAFSASTFSL